MLVQDLIKHRVYLEMQKNRINKNSLTTLISSINEFLISSFSESSN